MYSVELKALVASIFVYCDKQAEYADVDYGKGLPTLISVLEKTFPRFETNDEVEEEGSDEDGDDNSDEDKDTDSEVS